MWRATPTENTKNMRKDPEVVLLLGRRTVSEKYLVAFVHWYRCSRDSLMLADNILTQTHRRIACNVTTCWHSVGILANPKELQIVSSTEELGFDSQRDAATPAKPQIVFMAKEMESADTA